MKKVYENRSFRCQSCQFVGLYVLVAPHPRKTPYIIILSISWNPIHGKSPIHFMDSWRCSDSWIADSWPDSWWITDSPWTIHMNRKLWEMMENYETRIEKFKSSPPVVEEDLHRRRRRKLNMWSTRVGEIFTGISRKSMFSHPIIKIWNDVKWYEIRARFISCVSWPAPFHFMIWNGHELAFHHECFKWIVNSDPFTTWY